MTVLERMTAVLACAAGITLLCAVTCCAEAGRGEKRDGVRRPRIGLVLSGGGALGFAHVGVLRVLEEEHVPIDFIAGTSMGSIVGAAYASGRSMSDLEEILRKTDWDKLFQETPPRESIPFRNKNGREGELLGEGKLGISAERLITPQGVIEGQNIVPEFQRIFSKVPSPVKFDDLPVPYRAVAADIESGEAIVLDHGDLALAARASMSVPGFFSPVELNGRYLVDGGVAKNLPVDVAKNAGMDVLIVVSLPSDMKKKDELKSPIDLSKQILNILIDHNVKEQLKLVGPQDVVIEPDTRGFSATDFGKAQEIMSRGDAAARKVVAVLKNLAVPAEEYAQYSGVRTGRKPDSFVVQFVRLDNETGVSDERILSAVQVKAGEEFNRGKAEETVTDLFNTGRFASVRYQPVEENGQRGVKIVVRDKEWDENYLRFGFALEDDSRGDETYAMALGTRMNNLNAWGAYWENRFEIGRRPRLSSELYQPLGANSPWFVAPAFDMERRTLYLLEGQRVIAEYWRESVSGTLKAGYELWNSGEISAGYRYGSGRLQNNIGSEFLPNFSYGIGDLFARISIDTLDDPDFPTRGFRSTAGFRWSEPSLGARDTFQQAVASVVLPVSVGRNGFSLSADAGWSSNNLPVEQVYTLGGFLDVSGYVRDSLDASDFAVGRILYRRELSRLGSSLFGLKLYGGVSAELAMLHNDNDVFVTNWLLPAGSVFIAVDTPVLPAYVAFGIAEGGMESVSLFFGRPLRTVRY